ncbi:MAG: hypothetical protein Q7U60_08720 [Candidatus Methanoperedens sp.]|nr:hypothetical protein [Candidatus Methanoperedens sp.]
MENFIEKNLIPLLSRCINSSETELALGSLKAAKALVYYSPLSDLTTVLNNALQHKSKDVAYLSLDVLRLMRETDGKAKPLTPGEYKKILMNEVIPFLVTCFRSGSDDIVLNALNAVNVLSTDAEIKGILFNPIEKMRSHKNQQIANLALDIIRDIYIGKEIYIFEGTFDKISHLTLGVLRKIERLTGETKIERVKLVSAEILRVQQIKEKTFEEPRVQQIKEKILEVPRAQQVKERTLEVPMVQQVKKRPFEEPAQKEEELQSRIIEVLKKNPKYVEGLKEIKSKYKR